MASNSQLTEGQSDRESVGKKNLARGKRAAQYIVGIGAVGVAVWLGGTVGPAAEETVFKTESLALAYTQQAADLGGIILPNPPMGGISVIEAPPPSGDDVANQIVAAQTAAAYYESASEIADSTRLWAFGGAAASFVLGISLLIRPIGFALADMKNDIGKGVRYVRNSKKQKRSGKSSTPIRANNALTVEYGKADGNRRSGGSDEDLPAAP